MSLPTISFITIKQDEIGGNLGPNVADTDVGYYENPRNDKGIIRVRTTKQIRLWEMPRTLKVLETLNKDDFGENEFPSIYILNEGKKKAYVGEAKNIYNRLKTHMNNPEDKIKKWDKAVVINDGRPATLSLLNDPVIRKALELHLIKLLGANRYIVVSQGEPQKLNTVQKVLVGTLRRELGFVLLRKKISDPTMGYRALSKKVINLSYFESDYSITLEMLFKIVPYFKTCEIPVKINERVYGQSFIKLKKYF